jgi:hypothetical protein
MPKRGFACIEAEGRMQVRQARDFVLIFACGPVFECTFSILTRDGSWGYAVGGYAGIDGIAKAARECLRWAIRAFSKELAVV